MDHVLAKVKRKRKKQHFKLISDEALFEKSNVDPAACVPYNPDHNLDDDSWFIVNNFSEKPFFIDILRIEFDSKDYDNLEKSQFPQIAYLISVQDEDFYFQKVTPKSFIRKKVIAFGEAVEIEQSKNRLVINSAPDAIYFKQADCLIFRNIATISSIFKGIDELYKEATQEEVEEFLDESFIQLAGDYDVEKVSKNNRKRIALAMATLGAMSADDKKSMLHYIDEYCEQKLTFDKTDQNFQISNDNELKLLLYGIEQRFYTTPFSQERRVANSVQNLD